MQTPSRGNTVPAYVWGYPSIGVFVLAQGTPDSSFATLHSWVTGKAPKPENILDVIPADIQQGGHCNNAGTAVGAAAVFQCAGLRGAAGIVMYYLFASPQLLATGFSNLLNLASFHKNGDCMTNNQFTHFLINCRSDFTSVTPHMTGSIVEYTNTHNQPIIVSTDNQQKVMAVMVGTNDADLLNYWKQLNWVVTGH